MLIPATLHPDDKHNLKRSKEALPGQRILARRSGPGERVLSKDLSMFNSLPNAEQ